MERYAKTANGIFRRVAGFGKGLQLYYTTFFFFLPWAGPSIVSSLTSIKLLFSIEFLLLRPLPIALCSFQMGWFFTPLKNVDAQRQECKRANFCSICFIERLFFKSSGHSVLISTDTSRASVKLIELPVALGELWKAPLQITVPL